MDVEILRSVDEMKLTIDFNKTTGEIKPMHGTGQPPLIGVSTTLIDYLPMAGIPYSRLHDVGGPYGGNRYVDIPNIFRNFDADPDDENSYDFTFTDWLISELVKRDVEPIFRLGVTIENQYYMKAYRIFPPSDNKKWAKICEMIIRHYNEGWANGFHYNITYWEIWNEPENNLPGKNQMWTGTMEEYFDLYETASKHLKECFGDNIKVGGYASCGFYHLFTDNDMGMGKECIKYYVDFFEKFLKFCKNQSCPLDFFSWHSYTDVDITVKFSNYARQKLDEYGFTKTEHMLNEWNNYFSRQTLGTGKAAAGAAAMMCALQKTSVSLLAYYQSGIGVSSYNGMFNPQTCKPYPLYYSFDAFNELFRLKNELASSIDDERVKICAAASSENGAILLANEYDEDFEINVELLNNPFNKAEIFVIDSTHLLEKTAVFKDLSSLVLKANSCILVKLH